MPECQNAITKRLSARQRLPCCYAKTGVINNSNAMMKNNSKKLVQCPVCQAEFKKFDMARYPENEKWYKGQIECLRCPQCSALVQPRKWTKFRKMMPIIGMAIPWIPSDKNNPFIAPIILASIFVPILIIDYYLIKTSKDQREFIPLNDK